MSDQRNGGIAWTDETWNPIRGCSRVSEGCRNCYAERMAARFAGPGRPYEGLVTDKGRWNGVVRLVPEHLADPLRWKRPRRIFVNSMSDLFHESLSDETIADVFGVMAASQRHTFQVLTKRPERAVKLFERMATNRCVEFGASAGQRLPDIPWLEEQCFYARVKQLGYGPAALGPGWPLPNVWLGVSVEDQAAADKRIPLLLQCPAAVRWISAEPLLGPVDFTPPKWRGTNVNQNDWLQGIDWVVAGGESGPNARPMHPDWARGVRDACVGRTDMGRPWALPFHFKQWGEWAPNGDIYDSQIRVGKHAAGRELDGQTWDEYPAARSAARVAQRAEAGR